MKSWNELSMAEKADVMKLAVEGGVYDLDTIRDGYNEYASGGKIHIAPSKRGTFTAAASRHGMGVQQFASKVLAHPENYSSAMRKKANFARNAAKWKHGDGGNLYAPGGEITYGYPYYSYDDSGNRIDNTLNFNATIPEVIIVPDSKKSPAERNADERYRQKYLKDYEEHKSKEYTSKRIAQAQKEWDNSTEKKALELAQSAATGIGIGADIVSGLPIYSSLKGAKVISEAETPMDYAEGALWLSPIGGIAGKEAVNVSKTVARKAANTVRPIIENKGFAVTNPFTGDINWIGKGLGSYIEVSPTTDGWLGVDYINSTHSGTGRKLYDAAIEEAHKRGLKGVKSGESLHSAPKTYKIWEHYSDKVHLGDYGSHGNSSMIDAPVTTKVNSPEELVEATKQGINAAVMKKAPVYGLTTPSNDVPLLSFSRESSPNIMAEQEDIIKDAISKFFPKGKIEDISIEDKQAGYQRMIDFISSPEYQKRLDAAGLGDYRDYMINLIEKRLNKGDFPAKEADIVAGRKNVKGVSEMNPLSREYGVTVKKGLDNNDFLNVFDHELAHWTTKNTQTGLVNDIVRMIKDTKIPDLKLQKIMKYNDEVAPMRSWKEIRDLRIPNLAKAKEGETESLWKKFLYRKNGQERRSMAYAMTQEAKRRGISTDELVDMYTVDGDIMGEAPQQLQDLSIVYSPENIKKYLKGFLSITTPVSMGLNLSKDDSRR